MKHGRNIITTMLIRPDQMARLDKMARRLRRSRSWVLREMLDRAFAREGTTAVPDEAA